MELLQAWHKAPSTPSHQLHSLSDFTHGTDGEADIRRAGDFLDTHRSGSRDRTGTRKKPGVPAFGPALILGPTHSLESFSDAATMGVKDTPESFGSRSDVFVHPPGKALL